MNEDLKLPRRKPGDRKIITYGFPQDTPIFWGPNQLNADNQYQQPTGWKYNECLITPWVVRFCHDDRTVDSDTADNTGGNDGGGGEAHGWTMYHTACYASVSICLTDAVGPHGERILDNPCPYTAPACGLNSHGDTTTTLPYIADKAEQEACCCSSFYTPFLPTITPGYSYHGGWIQLPLTGGSPRFDPSTPVVLILTEQCDEYETPFWTCLLEHDPSRWLYSGTIAGACAAGFMFHQMSITTWFWKKENDSAPDGFDYTYTQWVNNRWLDELQTIPNPDFVNMEWCHSPPIPPSFP